MLIFTVYFSGLLIGLSFVFLKLKHHQESFAATVAVILWPITFGLIFPSLFINFILNFAKKQFVFFRNIYERLIDQS